ncbi:MAG TPA: hypothetical protein DHW49_05340 [Anaerolineae bacterium]|nr:hypothetical protein [Anaerolineae bacterium]
MARIEKTVFISYRRTNFWTALAVYQNLHANGFDVFFDYKSIPSGDFAQVITENVISRAHFVLILSPSALERCHEPNDWLRREIETAMDYQRNIIPLMIEGFDFGSKATVKALTGKLMGLGNYNAISIPAEYFDDAMNKLRSNRFLSRPLESVTHPISTITERITEEQKSASNEAEPVREEQLTAIEWFERGYVFDENKNFEEALRCYTEAIKLDPNLYVAYNNLGNLFKVKKNYEKAEIAYRKAIELNSSDAAVYSNFGVFLNDLERYTEAETMHRKAIELNPSDSTSHFNLGTLLHEINRYKEAEILYILAIELNANFSAPYCNLGNLLEKKADFSSAIYNYERYLELGGGIEFENQKQIEKRIKDLKQKLTKKKPVKKAKKK